MAKKLPFTRQDFEDALKQAFLEGKKAALSGDSVDSCKLKTDSLRREWERGWRSVGNE